MLLGSSGGVAFSIGLNQELNKVKPPHFLEKLPAIPTNSLSNKGSWQTNIEEKQRIAGARHEEYLQTISQKARERSARQKRTAGKLREQLRKSRQEMEEKLRSKLSTFEENKNTVIRQKLQKIKKMRAREEIARRRLEKRRRVAE